MSLSAGAMSAALVIFHGLEVSHGSCPPSKRRNYANASGKNGPWGGTSRSADASDRGRGTTGGPPHPPLPPALGASPIGPKMTLRRDRFGGEREHVAQPRLPSRETSPEPLLWRISQLLRRNRGKGWSLFPSPGWFFDVSLEPGSAATGSVPARERSLPWGRRAGKVGL